MRFRAFITLLILAVMAGPSWGSWSCIVGANGCTTVSAKLCTLTNNTCTITVPSTTAGTLEVACGSSVAQATTSFTFSGDGTWVTPTGSLAGNSTGGSVQCAYNLSATGGATSITCTSSVNNTGGRCAWINFSYTGAAIFDTGSVTITNSEACTTSCTGVALTLATSKSYLLVQAANISSSNAISNCSGNSNYIGNFVADSRLGICFAINQTSAGTTPSFTTSGTNTTAVSGWGIYVSGVLRRRASLVE